MKNETRQALVALFYYETSSTKGLKKVNTGTVCGIVQYKWTEEYEGYTVVYEEKHNGWHFVINDEYGFITDKEGLANLKDARSAAAAELMAIMNKSEASEVSEASEYDDLKINTPRQVTKESVVIAKTIDAINHVGDLLGRSFPIPDILINNRLTRTAGKVVTQGEQCWIEFSGKNIKCNTLEDFDNVVFHEVSHYVIYCYLGRDAMFDDDHGELWSKIMTKIFRTSLRPSNTFKWYYKTKVNSNQTVCEHESSLVIPEQHTFKTMLFVALEQYQSEITRSMETRTPYTRLYKLSGILSRLFNCDKSTLDECVSPEVHGRLYDDEKDVYFRLLRTISNSSSQFTVDDLMNFYDSEYDMNSPSDLDYCPEDDECDTGCAFVDEKPTSFFSALRHMLEKEHSLIENVHYNNGPREIFAKLYSICSPCELPLCHYISNDAQDAMEHCTYEEFRQLLRRIVERNRYVEYDFIYKWFQNLQTINESKEFDGLKYDADKPHSGLLIGFAPALNEVAKVATFGAKKYGRDNWKNLENGKVRYFDAAWRHRLAAGGDFDSKDEESNLDHLAHDIWNMLAFYTFILNERKK